MLGTTNNRTTEASRSTPTTPRPMSRRVSSTVSSTTKVTVGERSGVAAESKVSSIPILLVVLAAGLLILATVVPVQTGLRLLGAFEPFRWYALEPFALALTFLFALRFINRRRSLVAGVLIGGGSALVLSFVAFALPPFFYEDASPGLGGWLGIAGGALALGTGLAVWRGKFVSPRQLA